MKTIEHWVAGKTTTGVSDRTAPVYNPATGEQQAEVLLADVSDVEAATAAASDAFPDWSQTSISKRTKVLFAFREIVNARASEIAEAITDEHGKVLSDALGEVQRGLEVVEFACGIPSLLKGDYSDQVSTDVDTFSFREPLGVVAGITPFNFPAMVPMWMFPVAIACGNTFVLKPSERDPSASMLIAQMWQEAGLPDGVFNVVHGDKLAVDTILDSPDVAAVSSSARRRSRSTSTSGVRRTASGCKHSVGPRTTRSSCRTPTSTSRPITWLRRPSGPPASAAWRSPQRLP